MFLRQSALPDTVKPLFRLASLAAPLALVACLGAPPGGDTPEPGLAAPAVSQPLAGAPLTPPGEAPAESRPVPSGVEASPQEASPSPSDAPRPLPALPPEPSAPSRALVAFREAIRALNEERRALIVSYNAALRRINPKDQAAASQCRAAIKDHWLPHNALTDGAKATLPPLAQEAGAPGVAGKVLDSYELMGQFFYYYHLYCEDTDDRTRLERASASAAAATRLLDEALRELDDLTD